jgi:hypothetical protein
MFSRLFTPLLLALLFGIGLPSICKAQALSDEDDLNIVGGFAKPYEYERQAFGYDPEGVEYKENQAEDFQVIFITAAPFATLASFGIYGTISLFSEGNFGVGGNYFLPFIGTAIAGSTAIACISVLSNSYPPPHQTALLENQNQPKALAFQVPLITARF